MHCIIGMFITVYASLYEWINTNSPAPEREQKIFTLLQRDVKHYGNDDNFDPSFVLVVTYHRMIPFNSVSMDINHLHLNENVSYEKILYLRMFYFVIIGSSRSTLQHISTDCWYGRI